MPGALVLHLEGTPIRTLTGVWCPHCHLPSGYTVHVALTMCTDPTHILARIALTRCTECGQRIPHAHE